MNSNVLLQIGFAFGTFAYKFKKKLRKQKWNLTDNTQNRNYHSKGTRKGARWWHAFLRAHSMCNDLQMRRHICGTLGHEFRNVTWHDFLRQFPSWPKTFNVNHPWRWKFTNWNIKPKWGKISKLDKWMRTFLPQIWQTYSPSFAWSVLLWVICWALSGNRESQYLKTFRKIFSNKL